MSDPAQPRRRRSVAAVPDPAAPTDVDALLVATGRGDDGGFTRLYDIVAPRVYGLILRVLRDPSQAEEVSQEVFVELWRTAARFDPARGGALAWVLTLAHRRAVDRVRAEESAAARAARAATVAVETPFDAVAEEVAARLEHQQVRRCLDGLTGLQRQAVTLAFYDGRSYPEVAGLLGVGLPTVKSRMRDGLIRLRDCLGVEGPR